MFCVSRKIKQTAFDAYQFATCRQRIDQIYDVFSEGKELLVSIKELSKICGAFRNVATIGKYTSIISRELKYLEYTKYLGIAVTPLYTYEFGRHSVKVLNRTFNGHFLKAMKSTAKVVHDAASLTQVGGTTVIFLKEVGAIAPQVAAVASVIYGIAGFLSIATIGLNTWGLIATCRHSSLLNEEDGFAIDLLKQYSDKELKKMFSVKGVKDALDRTDIEQKDLMQALRTRLTYKKITHSLKILSATITIIATGILLTHAGAPAGIALLAVSGLISFTASIVNLVATEKLKYAIYVRKDYEKSSIYNRGTAIIKIPSRIILWVKRHLIDPYPVTS